tara:strand:+ start:2593 stop:2943 length:351 start_codon:yes stop_codon:yes gene_type:complete
MSNCKRPCKECAFRNDSVEGFFGGNLIEVYRNMYRSDVPVPCHMKSHVGEDGVIVEDNSPCIGHLLAQAKSCKSPRSTESSALIAGLKAQSNYGELRMQVLAQWEFDPHHEKAVNN